MSWGFEFDPDLLEKEDSDHVSFEIKYPLFDEDLAKLRQGYYHGDMEERWMFQSDGYKIYFLRSWTRFHIFTLTPGEDGIHHMVTYYGDISRLKEYDNGPMVIHLLDRFLDPHFEDRCIKAVLL